MSTTTPTPAAALAETAEQIAERIFPSNANTTVHQDWAAEKYRLAVTAALQAKDDRIAALERRVALMKSVALAARDWIDAEDVTEARHCGERLQEAVEEARAALQLEGRGI